MIHQDREISRPSASGGPRTTRKPKKVPVPTFPVFSSSSSIDILSMIVLYPSFVDSHVKYATNSLSLIYLSYEKYDEGDDGIEVYDDRMNQSKRVVYLLSHE